MAVSQCPECGASFDGLSSEEVVEHRNHWPDDIPFPRVNAEAVRRAGVIEAEAADRQIKERQAEARRTLDKG